MFCFMRHFIINGTDIAKQSIIVRCLCWFCFQKQLKDVLSSLQSAEVTAGLSDQVPLETIQMSCEQEETLVITRLLLFMFHCFS